MQDARCKMLAGIKRAHLDTTTMKNLTNAPDCTKAFELRRIARDRPRAGFALVVVSRCAQITPGMGVAFARQAALSLYGEITLSPREPHGAKFEFRWPHGSQ